MKQRPLLVEIGCEELPSSSLKQLGESLERCLLAQLASEGLSHGSSRWLASPRRLAVIVEDLVEQAPDESREALGPPVAQARDADGNWTRAAQGFAANQGVSPEELAVIDTPKGPRLGLQQTVTGARTVECLAALVNQALDELPIAKRMRWGASRREFVRPVHWVVLLYGQEYGFGEVLGLATGNRTRGHRFHAPGLVSIQSPEDYEGALRDARVVADFNERQNMIRQQVNDVAATLGATAVIDEDLLIEVTSLVEWPVALTGSFDEAFLKVPAEPPEVLSRSRRRRGVAAAFHYREQYRKPRPDTGDCRQRTGDSTPACGRGFLL